VRTRYLSHKRLKSIQGCKLGASAWKSTTRTGQDNKRSQNRNISHIWEQVPRNAIAMKYGTWVGVHEIVAWAEFDL